MIKMILMCVFIAVSCGSSESKLQQSNVDYQVLLEGDVGGQIESDVLPITNDVELNALYATLNATIEPAHEIPDIDFTKTQLIAIFMGEKTSSGFHVEVEKITESKTHIILRYKENGPKPTDMVANVMTQPFCVIKLPKVDKPLKIELL